MNFTGRIKVSASRARDSGSPITSREESHLDINAGPRLSGDERGNICREQRRKKEKKKKKKRGIGEHIDSLGWVNNTKTGGKKHRRRLRRGNEKRENERFSC